MGNDSQWRLHGEGNDFSDTTGGVFTSLYEFTGNGGAVPGETGYGDLLRHTDGNLYGVTSSGGATPDGRPAGGGTVFRLRFGPTPWTTGISNLAESGVMLSGTVNPNSSATSASFEWGTSRRFLTQLTPPQAVGSGAAPIAVSTALANLAPGTTFYYRVRGDNAEQLQPQRGAILSFTTPGTSPLGAWKLAHLGDANAPDLDDPDHDGAVTLAEYGLHLLPESAEDAPLSPSRFAYAEGERLRLMIQRDPVRADVSVEVQAASSVAGPWNTIASSVLGAPFSGPGYFSGDAAAPGLKNVEIRDTVNVDAATQRFLRVKVVH